MSFAEESLLRRRQGIVCLPVILLIGLAILLAFQLRYSGWNSSMETTTTELVGVSLMNTESKTSEQFYASHRKILQAPEGSKVGTDRIWNDKCSTSDILITQGPTDPLPNGIPTYTVQISNVSPTGCTISGIHLRCGWFSSATVIDPRIFKRLHFDDCLVNDGKPLVNGRTFSFQYANTFSYRMFASSVNC